MRLRLNGALLVSAPAGLGLAESTGRIFCNRSLTGRFDLDADQPGWQVVQ